MDLYEEETNPQAPMMTTLNWIRGNSEDIASTIEEADPEALLNAVNTKVTEFKDTVTALIFKKAVLPTLLVIIPIMSVLVLAFILYKCRKRISKVFTKEKVLLLLHLSGSTATPRVAPWRSWLRLTNCVEMCTTEHN